jgi:hypothetical protein
LSGTRAGAFLCVAAATIFGGLPITPIIVNVFKKELPVTSKSCGTLGDPVDVWRKHIANHHEPIFCVNFIDSIVERVSLVYPVQDSAPNMA